jgi:hypothetical protein
MLYRSLLSSSFRGVDFNYIKAGWRAAGLHPYNPNKALTSSLIVQASLTSQTAPKTPPRPLQLIITTPHNRRELQATFDSIRQNESLLRTVRMLFNKTAKAFDELHYNTAENTLLLKGQQQKLEELRARKRRKVAIDAQKAFADIETIKAAKDMEEEIARGEAYRRRTGQATARATSNAMMEKDIEAFTNSWALEIATSRP